jgi:hypothetical protein
MAAHGRLRRLKAMDSTQIERQVRDEWRAAESGRNPHGLSPDRNLVIPPYPKTFRNSFFESQSEVPFRRRETLTMWVVVDELQESDKEGYLIVFDDRDKKYGLAIKPDLFIGYYGTLVETIAAM